MERNDALERHILQAPGERTGYSIYGDWLTERGDPRGELVAVQVARADPARSLDAGLRWREEHLLREHRDHLLGPLAPFQKDIFVEHSLGFLGSLQAQRMTVEHGIVIHDVLGLVIDALRSPEGRFVHSLGLHVTPPGNDFRPVFQRLAAHGPYPAMRALAVGDGARMEVDLGPLWPVLPRLRSLTLRTPCVVDFGEVRAPWLEEIIVDNASWVWTRAHEALFASKLPRLHTVEIDRPRPHFVGVLADLLAARNTPALRTLSLMHVTGADELADALARAEILEQLRVLDLSGGDLTDEGALALARSGRLRGLARFLVTGNELTPEGLETLRQACPNVVSDMQKHDEAASVLEDWELWRE